MTFAIRPVTAADLPAIVALNEAEVPHLGSTDHEQMRWFMEHAAYFRVAVCGNDLAAFLVGLRPGTTYTSPNYRWFCERYAEFAYIDRVAVAALHRRQGLGTRLYDDLIARMDGVVPLLTCEVNLRPPNPESMRFHQALGFDKVGKQDTMNGSKTVAMLARPL